MHRLDKWNESHSTLLTPQGNTLEQRRNEMEKRGPEKEQEEGQKAEHVNERARRHRICFYKRLQFVKEFPRRRTNGGKNNASQHGWKMSGSS